MRKRLGQIVSVLLIFALVISPFAVLRVAADTEKKDPVAEYEEKLKAAEDLKEQYEKQKAETEALLEEYKKSKENIEQYIVELDLQLNDISLRIFELQQTIAETEEELEQTRLDLEEAKQKEADQYDIMKRRIQYMYENGETTYWDVLLNSGSIADMLNQFEYVQGITEYDNSLLERYEAAKENVIQKEAYLEASLEELRLLQENEQLAKASVEDLMALKTAEIEKYTEQIGITDELLFTYISEISSQEMTIEQIKEDEKKRLEEEERKRKEEEERLRRIEEEKRLAAEKAAREAAAKAEAAKKYDANAIKDVVLTDETDIYHMIWPLPGDHRTYSKFGPRKAPTKGASTFHKGWDIGGEFGAPIVSVLAGVVESVGYTSSAGNYVRVEHQPGFVSVYCHCSKTLVSEGDYVKQGEIVGLIGSTGVSTGPHLHFAIKVNGTFVDPAPYISHLE